MDVYGFVSRLLALAAVTAAVLFITVCGEGGPEPTVPAEAEPAVTAAAPIREGEGEFANVLISTEGGVSLERAWLLVNNEPRASFAQGTVQIRVYDGDVLAVEQAVATEITLLEACGSALKISTTLTRVFFRRNGTTMQTAQPISAERAMV